MRPAGRVPRLPLPLGRRPRRASRLLLPLGGDLGSGSVKVFSEDAQGETGIRSATPTCTDGDSAEAMGEDEVLDLAHRDPEDLGGLTRR